jgi:uncharacterized protein (UPF0262 family)
MDDSTDKLVNVNLDATLSRTFSADVDHERKVAIYDLLESNTFKVEGKDSGPYALNLSIDGTRLVFDITDKSGETCA